VTTERDEAALAHVRTLRKRLERAKARGQIELHLHVDDVHLLLTLAEILLDARAKAKEKRA